MAKDLKHLLLLLLLAICIALVYQIARVTGSDIQALRWHHHAATISSTAYDDQVEIEIDARIAAGIPGHLEPEGQTPRNPSDRQILVPATPGALHMHGTEIILLQNPADPSQVRILSYFAMLAVPVAYLLGLLAVGAVALRLYRHVDLREKARRRSRIGSRPSSLYMHHFRDKTGKLVLELSSELAREDEIEKRLGLSHGD